MKKSSSFLIFNLFIIIFNLIFNPLSQGERRVANTYPAEANDPERFNFNLTSKLQKSIEKEKESIEKEKELGDEERIARKRAAELEQVDDAGEREVQECVSDLEFALEELDLAKDSLKKLFKFINSKFFYFGFL